MSALLSTFDFAQGDAMLPKLHDAAKEIHEDEYRHARSIKWRNVHTTKFAALLGDDKLVCGYDGEAGRWCFASLRKRTVVTMFGVRQTRVVEEVPVIWWHVEDDTVDPPAFVAITDPRIPDMLLKSDTYKNPNQFGQRLEKRRTMKAARKASRRREWKDRFKEAFPTFQREADALGYGKPHRSTANDGVKTFSYTGERDRDPSKPEPIKVNDKRVR
ncbi:MAG: hypothetical protein A3E78_08750 [Alphaproteobacteria bacterium RIFCSPHIGHO2_12_FULL_63_12]|nr:MAG: hypothetical protein A3E78_08750 [Alphaproteobacteria bacterium RIFCSPHIGHO2_12_FULL_63_12]